MIVQSIKNFNTMKNIFTNLSIALLFFAIVACDKSDDPDKIIEQPEEEQPVGKNYRVKSIVTHNDNHTFSSDSLKFIYEDNKLVRINKTVFFQDEWMDAEYSVIKYADNKISLDLQYDDEEETIIIPYCEYTLDGDKIIKYTVYENYYSDPYTDVFLYDSQGRLITINTTSIEGEEQTKMTYINDKIETRGYWDTQFRMLNIDSFFYENEKLAIIRQYTHYNDPIQLDRKIVYSYNSIGNINKIDYWGPEGDYWGNTVFTYNEDGLLIKAETEDYGKIVEQVFYKYEEGEGNAEFFEYSNMYNNFNQYPTYTRKNNTKPELRRPAFRLSPLKF